MIKGGNQLSQLPSNEDLAMEDSRIINQSLCAYVRWVSKPKDLEGAIKEFRGFEVVYLEAILFLNIEQ